MVGRCFNLGIADVNAKCKGTKSRLPLVLVQNTNGARMPALIGCDWLKTVKLDWNDIFRDIGTDKGHLQRSV